MQPTDQTEHLITSSCIQTAISAVHTNIQQRSDLLTELALERVFKPRFPLYVTFEDQEITAGDEVMPQKVGGWAHVNAAFRQPLLIRVFVYVCAHQLDRVPSVTFDSGDKFYSFLLLDPDAPSIQMPTDRSVVVVMVINIPGRSHVCTYLPFQYYTTHLCGSFDSHISGEEGDAAVGDAVWPYIPPSDLPGHTDMHR